MVRAIVLAATMVLAAPANALPDGRFGQGCYDAAAFVGSLRQSLDVCNAALHDRRLSVRDRSATLVNRGIVQLHARRYRAALTDFDAALALAPMLTEALINKGITLMAAGRPAEAVDLLTAALDVNPARPELAYYTRAMANEEVGATRAAYDDYRRAAELAPDWAEPAEQLRRFTVVRRPTALG